MLEAAEEAPGLAGTAHAEVRESREATVTLLGWGPSPSLAVSWNLAEMEVLTLPATATAQRARRCPSSGG
jgi:hypothetical protein